MTETPFDRQMMQRCITLAQKAWGRTAPNPLVGAVVVRDGQIIGEGFHPGAGQPHAEVFALRAAGELARGATLYVNLEPCNHYGRTPPCSGAVVAAGLNRVVVGMVDPNPLVAGGGIVTLEAAGIETLVGVETTDCERLNEGFIHRIRHHRPLGILKYAMTLDGRIATDRGHSAWVSGEPARDYVHHVRAGCDAIVVGGNTVRRDNPHLTSHHPDGPNPLRIVMSKSLDLPDRSHLWDVDIAPTLVVTGTGTNPDKQQHLKSRGVEVLELDLLTPDRLMQHLYERGCLSVLWECGGTLSARAIADRSIQKVLAFIAPKIIGGTIAPSPVGDLGLQSMTEALTLDRITWQQIGADILLEGYLQ
jgi:diaminohydroxyphosphoribosylaminopyrimidine deaminase / 5-amino-6-(5-phosphoribosylamino)uracil reductase